MFELNFISDPGIQKEESYDCWSFLHKRKTDKKSQIEKDSYLDKTSKVNISLYAWVISLFLIIGIGYNYFSRDIIRPEMILNQVIDLIIESEYIENIKLEEVNFLEHSVNVILKSDQLNMIQNFTQDYRTEDRIPFKIFQKNKINYLSMEFPWRGGVNGGDLAALKSLSRKTVFSNKMSINVNKSYFELIGRSSDIISYLLHMAENRLIQKFIFSINRLKSGQYYLIIQSNHT